MATSERFNKIKRRLEQQGSAANQDASATQRSDRYNEIMSRLQQGQFSTSVDEEYVNTFLKDMQTYAHQTKKNYEALGYESATSKDQQASRKSSMEDLTTRAGKVRVFVNANKDRLDNETYSGLMQSLDNFSNFQNQYLRAFRNAESYYSRWDTEEDYNAFVAGQKEYEDQLSLDLDAAQKEIDALYAQADALDPMLHTDRKQMTELSEQINQKKARLEAARKAQGHAAQGKGYASLRNAEGFSTDSSYAPKQVGAYLSLQEMAGMSDEEQDAYFEAFRQDSAQEDLLYEAVNGNYLALLALNRDGHDIFDGLNDKYRKTPSELMQMEQNERDIFNYVYKTKGLDEAKSYLNYLAEELSDRQRAAVERAAMEKAEKQPFVSSLDVIATSPFRGQIGLLGMASDLLDGGGIENNADYNLLDYQRNATTGKVSQKISDSWAGDVGAFLYGTGMSMGESLARIAVAGGNPLIGSQLAFSDAAASTAASAKDRGLSDAQAVGLGLISGAAEAAMEKFSLETLLNPDYMKDGTLKYILKNAMSEGGEEVSTDVVNTVADILIAQDKSEWQTAVDAYKAQGMRDNEAFLHAFGDKAVDLVLSGLGGAISGGVMAGGNAAINNIFSPKISESIRRQRGIEPQHIPSAMETEMEDTQRAMEGGATVSPNVLEGEILSVNQQGRNNNPPSNHPVFEMSDTDVPLSGTISGTAGDGKTYFRGEKVNIMGVASVKDGAMKLKLEDGRTVDAKEVEYGSADEAVVYGTVANLGVHALGANMLIENYTPGGDVSATVYAKGIEEAYAMGQLNVPQAEVAAMPFASQLAPYQRQAAYQLGELFGGKQTAKEQAQARKNRSDKGADTSRGKVHFEGDRNSLNDTQKAGLDAMEVMSKALGVQFYVFESEVDENGNHVGANGWYDPSDGSIHIDLYAGNSGKGTMLFTVAHELTHFIRQWSPAKFKVLANVLMKQYGQQGVPVNELVQSQIDKAKRSDREISYDTAYEEVIADSMEAMLADGSIIEMMAELKQQDQSLWQKIRSWFKDLAGKLRAVVDAYKGVRLDSIEGRMVADMKDMIGTLEALYMDALVDASENFNAGVQKNTAESGVKYQARRLSENDLEAYLRAGTRRNQNKFEAVENGKQIILTSEQEITDFIANAIDKKAGEVTVAYGKVNDRLASEVSKQSKGKITIDDYYLELIPTNLQHAYEEHSTAKEEGDIALTKSDFEKIPEYLDSFTEVLYAIKYSSGSVRICVSKKLPNGRILIIETVSKSRGSIQFKNAIGVSEEKYVQKYLPEYKKRAETNTRGSESSNISLRDSSNSNISIRNDGDNVNKKFSARDSAGNQLSAEQREYFKDSAARDNDGNLLVLYHQTDGDFTIFDTRHPGAGSRDNGTPFGIFMKRSAGDIGLAGKKQMELYANITNPLRAMNREDLDRQLREISVRYASISDQHKKLDAEYREKFEQAKKAWVNYITEWRSANPGASRNALNADPKFNELYDAEDNVVDEWTAVADRLSAQAKKAITEDLRKAGYDGVFLAEDVGSWGRKTDAIIALDPEQVKNISNKKPTQNPDIRYSQRDVAHKNTTADSGGVKYSLRAFEDGTRFVDVQMDPSVFDGMTVAQMNQKAKKILMEKFAGRVIGIENRVFINGDSVNEYLHPSKSIDLDTRKAKLTASGELDNLLDAGVALPNEPDGKDGHVHPDAIDFSYYKTIFKVGAEYFEGIVNIKNIKQGKLFKDVTKIRNITKDIVSSYGQNPKSNFLRDASMNSIRNPGEVVNKKISDRDSAGNQLFEGQQEYFKDSKERDNQGRLRVMYRGDSTEVTVFDRKKSSYSNLYGRGFYFTNSASHAGQYGQATAYYLNITNPVSTTDCTITKEQMRKFLEAVAENEDDYSFENYGYGATVESVLEGLYTGKSDFAMLYDVSQTAIGDMVEAVELFNKTNGTNYDGFILDTETVIFNSAQAKRTDNHNPTANPDTRFSLRDPDRQKVTQALEKENARLREDVAELRELVKLQRSVTGGTKFTKTSVEAAARYLKQNANAKGDTKELMKLLNGLYEYIASGRELTWEGVMEQAHPAVEWLENHALQKGKRSEYAQDILNRLHGSRVYLDESQIAEAEYRFGTYTDYRRQLMGSIVFAKDANTSLDSLWQELSEQYPDVFDRDTTSTDMPGALADIIQRLRNEDTTALEYARNREMRTHDLLQQVYDSYWRVSTLYTVADVKQRQINRLKGEHYQRMNRLREQHRENVAQLKQAHRERLERVRQDYRERAQERERKLREAYQQSRQRGIESRRKTEMRHKIQKAVKKLNDLLLNETRDRHVPDKLKKAVAEALDAINMDTVGADERIAKYDELIAGATDPDVITSLTESRDRIAKAGERLADRIGKLKAAYDSIKSEADSASIRVYDEVIANKIQEVIDNVGDTALRDMTLDQLEAVYEMYTMIAKSISNANRSFREERGATIAQMGMATIREVGAVKGERRFSPVALANAEKFGWDMLKPYYAFSMIGSETLSRLYDNVRRGEDVWAVDMEAARKFYRVQSEKYGYDSWDMGKEYSFQDVSGREFELNLQQIMSLYAYSKRAQADKHLQKGGFVFDSAVEVLKKRGGVPVRYHVNTANAYNLNSEQIRQIVETLTKEQAAFVDAMQTYLSDVMGQKGNEVSLALYDVRLFKEKNYFPLKSAAEYTFQQTEDTGEVRLKNSGFSKKTVPNASNPIVLGDFMTVWGSHVNDMSMYHAFVLPLEDFNRVYNYKALSSEEDSTQSVKATLRSTYGIAATKYIRQMLEDINGGARADDRAGILSRWMGRFKKGSVFANASVVIQQPSAIARATALIEPQYFIGARISQKRHAQLWEEVKQYAPVAIIKEMGYFDTNMGLSSVEYLTAKEYETIGERARAIFADGNYRDEVLSRPAALADEFSWCYIWEAVKRETRGNHPEMDTRSDAFLRKAGERFTEVITRTQVYDSVLSRSGLMRSKDTGAKMMTAFMSEPTTSMNMVVDAIVQGGRGQRWYARNAVGAVVASLVLNSLLVSFVYAARDDDEEKSYWEKYLANFAGKTLDSLNPLTYLPFIKDIVSITRGYTVERSDMSVISDIWAAWQKLPNKNVSLYRKIEDFGGSIAQAFGLPLKNIMRDIRAIGQTFESFWHGPETSWQGIGVAIHEGTAGKDLPKHRKLYEAMVGDDDTYRKRMESQYGSEAELESAVRKALREYDARICEAAEARYYGDFDEYERIFLEIEQERNFTRSQIAGAVQAELNAMSDDEERKTSSKAYGMYSMDDFVLAVRCEDGDAARRVMNEVIRAGQENGKTEDEAKDAFARSAISACKKQYLDGNMTEGQAKTLLCEYCGVDTVAARADMAYWKYMKSNPETDAVAEWFDAYYEKLDDSGIELDLYVEYRHRKIGHSKKADVMKIIDGMNLSDQQKDALYYAEGWASSTINEAPWHQ